MEKEKEIIILNGRSFWWLMLKRRHARLIFRIFFFYCFSTVSKIYKKNAEPKEEDCEMVGFLCRSSPNYEDARPDQTRPGQSKRWQSVESKDVILKCYSLHYKQRWGWGDMVGGPGHRVGCFCVHQFSIWMLLLLLLIRRNETAEKKLNFLSFFFFSFSSISFAACVYTILWLYCSSTEHWA